MYTCAQRFNMNGDNPRRKVQNVVTHSRAKKPSESIVSRFKSRSSFAKENSMD
jgi:hypothetical protein